MAAAVCQFACQLLVENCKPKYVVVKFQDGFVEAFNIQKRTPEFRFILAEVILDKEMGPRPGTSGLRIQHPLTGATFSLVAPTVTITNIMQLKTTDAMVLPSPRSRRSRLTPPKGDNMATPDTKTRNARGIPTDPDQLYYLNADVIPKSGSEVDDSALRTLSTPKKSPPKADAGGQLTMIAPVGNECTPALSIKHMKEIPSRDGADTEAPEIKASIETVTQKNPDFKVRRGAEDYEDDSQTENRSPSSANKITPSFSGEKQHNEIAVPDRNLPEILGKTKASHVDEPELVPPVEHQPLPASSPQDGAAPGAKGEEVDQVMQQVQLLLIDKSKASADKMQMERHIADLEERLEYLEETHDSLLEHFNEEMANLEREIEGKNRELTDLEDELSKRQDTIDEMTSQEALRRERLEIEPLPSSPPGTAEEGEKQLPHTQEQCEETEKELNLCKSSGEDNLAEQDTPEPSEPSAAGEGAPITDAERLKTCSTLGRAETRSSPVRVTAGITFADVLCYFLAWVYSCIAPLFAAPQDQRKLAEKKVQ
ncbi:hypothetical protein CYMTET_11419 [Cymbomonas tetramitiformis]|uniref:Uncharacterized protein n=1 Tax=Cymbomonas tetramitiformis TaxID=36881 RepID=A0AAE0LCV4_9CHLO|nr:hypothetical protein CYMTET_11419 [Cymbomonas tetramitiformis]